MVNQLNAIINSENKAVRSGRALLVSTLGNADIGSRLIALTLVEQGYNVILLDEVEDLSGLAIHPVIESFAVIGVYSVKTVNEHQLTATNQLEEQSVGQALFSELIQQLWCEK